MNYRTRALGLLAVCTLLFAACGGGGLKSSGAATVTLSFADGATGVALDAPVTTVFSAAIIAPTSWSSSFTLKKDNAGDSLCTAVTYDSATLTATCTHANFDRASSYTVGVSGLEDGSGLNIAAASATFQTSPAVTLLRLDGTVLNLTDSPIPRSAGIKYTLGSAMTEEADRTALEATITVTDAAAATVAGTYAWAANYLSVVFTPSSKLGYQTVYTVAIAGEDDQTFQTMTRRDTDGDGYADAAVGAYQAPYDTLNGVAGPGSAYVFLGSATGIANCDPVAEACTSTTIAGVAASDLFGFSVDLGDVNADGYEDLIVGAPYAPVGDVTNGAVYVYLGSADGISTTAAATLGGKVDGDKFGGSVSFGDFNGDGHSDALVGAYLAEGGKGRAYIFLGSANGIADCDLSDTCTADTTFTGAAALDVLGGSVSSGDFNGDGCDDVIVGAYRVDGAVANIGAAYIFHGSATGIEDRDLSAGALADRTFTGEAVNDCLGVSVSSGDFNGNGYSDALIGAFGWETGVGGAPGKAYVILSDGAGGIPSCTPGDGACVYSTITGSTDDNGINDSLGVSVSSADFDGDGYDDALVGAFQAAKNAAGGNGKALVFLSSGANGIPDCDTSGSCVPDTTVTGAAAGSRLGAFVSEAGDVNGDGYVDIAVGAASHPTGGTQWNLAGAAYYFLGSATGIADSDLSAGGTADTTIGGAANYDQLGQVR